MPVTWKQGEHVVLIGDTGSGKTYLESKILKKRDHVVVIRTKPDDIKFDGFTTVHEFTKLANIKHKKFLLTPKYELQQFHASRAMEHVWREGGWCIAIDEAYYATQMLRLDRPINKLATQGRSKHITLVAGMQRAAWVSRFLVSQATHAFIFRNDADLPIIHKLFGKKVATEVEKLHNHDFIYFNRVTKEVKLGNANRLGEIFN